MRPYILTLAAFGLMACGNQESRSADTAEINAATGTSASGTSAAVATDNPVALGMTERQLRDSELVGTNGEELGDVEGVVRGPDGTVTHLLVEIEDSSPDRYVHVAVEGLEPFDKGDDRDLRTTMTREQLMALPAVSR